ncbi:uncharacterized protein LOC115891308 isoform X2 [Sitophilus oryzae]|uniref:Uncharacterized protein LOC115891308 isoform X2 n=1 Tax=Sitophilus oryzae TaxID=7048 RepID=A0A6J2YWG1_SITOR|nr:uncharacterized protein LOC115891308 isoform X2 [Sitophilus oryzae]XP_030767614.1 uncharacterized protein LOC115891308 isoform X2 [Sitophilus oryzae]
MTIRRTGAIEGVPSKVKIIPSEYQRRRIRQIKGRGMSELGVVRSSPDSDCNSNLKGSCLSTTSSQDVDFIQDNSDYQWFLDYGYRDGGSNHHTSILSLPETYDAGDNYYEALAKNMDANLAEADMESFKTEDIRDLLTNLPPMCTDHLSQETNRQGESYAEVSGSMMGKFDLDSFISPHSSSQGEDCSANSNSMSICKSELLFSPVRECPMPGANFSVDSLDCDLHDMMLTCQANKDNYTIAFEGSVTMYSEDSDFHETDKSSNTNTNQSGSVILDLKIQKQNLNKLVDGSMTQSDSSSFTTWSKLKKQNSENHIRRPSGNNNDSEEETSHLALSDTNLKSQSMPNLYKQKLKNLINIGTKSDSNSSTDTTIKRRSVKVFDIHHQTQNTSGSGWISDMATSVDASSCESSNNKQPNFSLVKLFMKQKSLSQEGMSTTMDQLSSSENWPGIQSVESSLSDKNYDHSKNHEFNSDQKISDSSVRTYDLIAEEPEDLLSKSESVEQLSESISKIESVNESFENESKKSENLNNNDSFSVKKRPKISSPRMFLGTKSELLDRSIQTSQFSEITNLKNATKSSFSNTKQRVKLVEPSFLNTLKKEGEVQKPVYVLYPNYVLPDLGFLSDKNDITNMFLVPQKAPQVSFDRRRPFSFNDIETLKRNGFSHVKDWDSLNILLPQEYRKILSDVPELSSHVKVNLREKPTFMRSKRRPMSCDMNNTNISSSSSTATQPSSGYRGSSTILTDSQNSPVYQNNLNPLFVYRYDSVTSSEASLVNSDRQKHCITTTPPCLPKCVSLQHQESVPIRPPLPKGILRKADIIKRYSMYETSDDDLLNEEISSKRKSLPDTYYLTRNKRFSETEDEGVDAGTSSSSLDEHPESFSNKPDYLLQNISMDELIQLEEFLKLSGFSSSEEEKAEESLTHLKSYVSKFLSLKINQDGADHFGGKKSVSFAENINVAPKHFDTKHFIPPNNSPNVSALLLQKNFQPKVIADMTICEENENSPNYSSPQTTPIHLCKAPSDNYVQKRSLINGVMEAVDQVMQYFSLASNQQELNTLGDSSVNPACAKLALTTLCPALYAVLSDGLKPFLDTSFGAINNSVWQVVEASAQQGPLTKALNDLVMKINSEDVISEGLVKFNAFIFGLLNVRSLDAWTSYLKTRESILKKHYTADSLLVLSHTGGANLRNMLDAMIAALQPLAFLPFQFDLLFEYKQLHLSFKRMDSFHQLVSPTHKHASSPNYKQFLSTKYGLSVSPHSRSNSESDDISTATTVKNNFYSACHKDILSSDNSEKHKMEKERPRSCIEDGILTNAPNFKLGEDVNMVAKKRWSGIALNSKLYQVYDRLAKEDEDYVDSLETPPSSKKTELERNEAKENRTCEPESLDSNFSDEKPLNGKRFKKLQQRWEMLSGRDSEERDSPPSSPTHANKSKIPRPITSPVKPSGIPVLVSHKKITCSQANKSIPGVKGINTIKNSPVKNSTPRASRVDQVENEQIKHIPRPSSLPYKPTCQNNKSSKPVVPRRAASSSLNRKSLGENPKSVTPKVVRTVSHRLPSESGHLSYNEGERLKVVLEVDDKWLLCCRGTQKGLVPKSAVIIDNGRF